MHEEARITIGGDNGSGKSTAGKKVARRLHYEHFSSGDFARNLALDAGFSSITEYLAAGRDRGPELDKKIDDEVRRQGEKKWIVIDSRLAFHWIPVAFRVLLLLDPRIAAERAFADTNVLRRQSESSRSIDEAITDIIRRRENDVAAYQKLYDVDIRDPKRYDLVLDTGLPEYNGHPDAVVKTILEQYRLWLG